MNQHITKLIRQALNECVSTPVESVIASRIDDHGIVEIPNTFAEKFAELLDKDAEKKYFSAGYIAGQSDGISETVRECAEFIAPLGDYCGGHGEPSAPSSRECARRLKQHFGVEE